MSRQTIHVNYLARVEGEGELLIDYAGPKVEKVHLKIFEPPRFFEGFLLGRDAAEAIDITSRICGICPVAYQMSAAHALEGLAGLRLPHAHHQFRRALYCGEWIESHVLHILMLHAPDFWRCHDVVELAEKFPDYVTEGLRLKRFGNRLVGALAGREIHPINVKLGGCYSWPLLEDLQSLLAEIDDVHAIAERLLEWIATFQFAELERDYEFVSLRHPDEYPMNAGRIISSQGIDCGVEEFENVFEEYQVPHSNALQCRIKGRGSYLCGPLARFNLNFDRLSRHCQDLATDLGLEVGCRNPFKSIVVRMIEVIYAIEQTKIMLEQLIPVVKQDRQPCMAVEMKPGDAFGCTEAPRGLLFHHYKIDQHGKIAFAKIVPPTSQNQLSIEEDLGCLVAKEFSRPADELTKLCEQSIRNYDPCISCATHFLKVSFRPRVEGVSGG